MPELEASRNWHGALDYVWQWYVELSAHSPLTFTELAAWSQLTQRQLTTFEVDLLQRLDRLNRSISK